MMSRPSDLEQGPREGSGAPVGPASAMSFRGIGRRRRWLADRGGAASARRCRASTSSASRSSTPSRRGSLPAQAAMAEYVVKQVAKRVADRKVTLRRHQRPPLAEPGSWKRGCSDNGRAIAGAHAPERVPRGGDGAGDAGPRSGSRGGADRRVPGRLDRSPGPTLCDQRPRSASWDKRSMTRRTRFGGSRSGGRSSGGSVA